MFLAHNESRAGGAIAGVLTGLSAAVCTGGPGAPPFLRKLHTSWCGSLMARASCLCIFIAINCSPSWHGQVTLIVSLSQEQSPSPLHLAGQAACLRNLQSLQA